MKVESVIKINLNGEYEVVYVGADRGVARQTYKDLMNKKEEFLTLFQTSGYASRTMSKAGHVSHANREPLKPVEAPKKRKKKAVKEAPSEDSAE